jgi:hypothetical protein
MSSSSCSLIDTEQRSDDNSALIAAAVLEFVLDEIFLPESNKEVSIQETVSPAVPPFNGSQVPVLSRQLLNGDSSGIGSHLVDRGISAVSQLPERSNLSWVGRSQPGSPEVANLAEVTILGNPPVSAVLDSPSFSMPEKTVSQVNAFPSDRHLERSPGEWKRAVALAQSQKSPSVSEVERSVGQLRKSTSVSNSEGLSVSLPMPMKRSSVCQPKMLMAGNQSKDLERSLSVSESEKCQLETSRSVSPSEEDMFADHTEKSTPVVQLERNQSQCHSKKLKRNPRVCRSKQSQSVSQPERALAGRHSEKRSVSQPEMAFFGRLSKKSSFVRQPERVLSGSQSQKTPAASQPKRVLSAHRSRKTTSEKTPAVSQPEKVLSGHRSKKSTSFSQPVRVLPQSQPKKTPSVCQPERPIFDSAKEWPSNSLQEKHTSVETQKTTLVSQPERNLPGGQPMKSQNSQLEGSGSADLFEMSPRASSSPDVLEDFPSSPQTFSSADEPASQDSLLVALREDAPSFRPVVVFSSIYFQWVVKSFVNFNYFSVLRSESTGIFWVLITDKLFFKRPPPPPHTILSFFEWVTIPSQLEIMVFSLLCCDSCIFINSTIHKRCALEILQ